MKKILLTGAAMAFLGGAAFAQMQGGYQSQQNMNQQMQNMDQQNPRMHKKPAGDQEQANPEGAPSGQETKEPGSQGGRETQENTQMRGETRAGVHITPTKTVPSTERIKLRQTVIESGRAPRIENLNFTVRVGAPIPRSIRVVPVPEEIIALYPEWSGFLYFVSGDEIIVVDPNSFAVVGVLET